MACNRPLIGEGLAALRSAADKVRRLPLGLPPSTHALTFFSTHPQPHIHRPWLTTRSRDRIAYHAAGPAGSLCRGWWMRRPARVCRECPLPVNLMMFRRRAGCGLLRRNSALRISHGPGPYRAMAKWLETRTRAVRRVSRSSIQFISFALRYRKDQTKGPSIPSGRNGFHFFDKHRCARRFGLSANRSAETPFVIFIESEAKDSSGESGRSIASLQDDTAKKPITVRYRAAAALPPPDLTIVVVGACANSSRSASASLISATIAAPSIIATGSLPMLRKHPSPPFARPSGSGSDALWRKQGHPARIAGHGNQRPK